MPQVEIGVVGGSSLTAFFETLEEVATSTPYGPTSSPIAVGEVDGVPVAYLARLGTNREIPPHRVNYRANIWALRELGVKRIVAPAVCGALSLDLELGEFVVCDQFVDRTSGREATFYDGPGTTLVSAAEPFCDDLRHTLVETGRALDYPVRD